MFKNARRSAAALACCIALVTTSPTQAADEDAVATARAGVRALGKHWNGEVNAATRALYVELQRSAERSGVKVSSDVSYGSHELQVMDLFVPEDPAPEPMPVVAYFHGGGLTGGDKVGADGLIYSNIPTFFARHGVIGVNANYRLVPEVRWPAGPEDVRGVIAWIRENIEDYGGDPDAVFVMGNSAGTRHVASYLYHEPSHFDDGPGVAGGILSSGSYGASSSEANRAYYGEDPTIQAALVPLGLLDAYAGPEIPVFMWSAELDPAFIETPSAEMYAQLCAKYDDCPRFTQFQGHNHVSHVMSINSADDEVGQAVLEFVREVTSR